MQITEVEHDRLRAAERERDDLLAFVRGLAWAEGPEPGCGCAGCRACRLLASLAADESDAGPSGRPVCVPVA